MTLLKKVIFTAKTQHLHLCCTAQVQVCGGTFLVFSGESCYQTMLVFTHILVLRKRGITLRARLTCPAHLPSTPAQQAVRRWELCGAGELSRTDAILLALAFVGKHQDHDLLHLRQMGYNPSKRNG